MKDAPQSKGIYGRRFYVVKAIRSLHRQYGTWRKVADAVGIHSPAYWCLVANKSLRASDEAIEALRFCFHLPPRRANGQIERMRTSDLARYFAHRTPATYPPCVELWLP